MTVDECFRFLQFLSRKNQNGSITPSEFESVYNSSQRTWFDHLIGKITTAPHIALGQNERIAERLSPFKTTDEPITVTTQNVSYPAGFHALTSMADAATGEAMQYLDDTRLRGRINSAIDPINEAKPAVFTNAKTGWKIWPASLRSVLVSYYKLPENVVWGFTENNNGRPVYNPETSVQPKWDDLSNEEILARCCTPLGISFQSQQLVQFGQAAKLQGT